MSESDTGSELTVDHYQPRSAGGDDHQDNLVYACFRCNQNKGPFWPNPADREHGRRVLHPLRKDSAAHLRHVEEHGLIEALTETGRFHLALLDLNRPALVAHRLQQRLLDLLVEQCELFVVENAHYRTIISSLETYLDLLQGPGQ